ncbi:YihY/virulence factor BrkB family protein [Pseudonocardia sp. ICBG1293]|uniref:YihY/virulence factor BrkB family protein n=1 Tax=Pseudonocardia sp. ICBG1293 TaxID=2844382 RepID=UPI001CCD266C|nr:YihY/virulence factor BrkB family protein [Pseudonocardia sp. ICBG1293]
MSSVRPVPETRLMTGEELSADDAAHTVARYGLGHLLSAGFLRFRYGDGFSHARAFALQLALAAVPLIIAGVGLSAAAGAEGASEVVARTVLALSPGTSDELVADAVRGSGATGPGTGDPEDPGEQRERDDTPTGERGELVLGLGLLTAFAAATSAFAQLERGANRIYGTERDRPALAKYARAAVLTATAGVAMAAGLLLIVAGEPFGDAVREVYRWGAAAETVWDVVRWPAGLALLVVAVTVLLRFAPRRRQPGLSWLGVGAAVTVLLWLVASGLLGLYVAVADTFGETYGPLTAVMALLIWANITGVALLAGVALSAQLEAVRAGEEDPRLPDSDDDGIPDRTDPA